MNDNDIFRFRTRGVICIFTALAGLLWFGAIAALADTHYVSQDGANEPPYTAGWASAAHEIQWALNASSAGDTVLVNNGTYNLTNQIVVSKAVTLKSLNGTNSTFINGGYPIYTNRCIKINGVAAIVDGFTITNGYCLSNPWVEGEQGGGGVMLHSAGILRNCLVQDNTCINTTNNGTYDGGGGVFINRGSGMVTNCVIFRNTFLGPGHAGGVYLFASYSAQLLNSWIINNSAPSGYGGGAFGWQGTIGNCQFVGNYANYGGGLTPGTFTYGCRIYNNTAKSGGGGIGGNAPGLTIDCVISNNACTNGSGGGIGIGYGCNFSNCVIVGNYASGAGGGISASGCAGSNYRVKVANCVVYANQSANGGGGVYSAYEGTWKNCLIYCNTNLGANAGGFYGSYMGIDRGYGLSDVNNLTIVSNQCGTYGGGIRLEGNNANLVHNCIIFGNNSTGDGYDDVYNSGSNSNAYYNCCAPVSLAPDQGNIINNPLFVDQPNRNYRLSGSSPCINAGSNQDWMTNGIDLDGRMRIRYGAVDMGAYEYSSGGIIIKTQ